ncbi:hypothetical protein LOC68_05245 [Blastopirellula sp. JC732]|uniref:Uncharacterized protein n=1 Tax=Blastopirellula sediminis TaxID=2894196 RepID=A0A9X1SFI7_9BACT|nr:hypothetical protein [Blastopirellula sediminis]MCC9609431.1 hypothetical protein [Blastopirellula sediminis]MCC9627792.1 hypothetical protein [Blastopirellula sediminis]
MKYLIVFAVLSAAAAAYALAPPPRGPENGDGPPGQNCPGKGDPQMRDEGRRPPRPGDDRDPNGRPPRPGDERDPNGRPPRPGDDRRPPRREEPTVDLSKLAPGTVVFQQGYETDPRDGGRPVVLVAAGLGVTSDVFRDAFSGVRPARGRGPTGEEARRNKEVLMNALGPHGVTNDRLDEVSNYYRYRPQNGELWTHTPAKATAIIENGMVTGLKIDNPGAGYSSPPKVVIAGYPDVEVKAEIEFGKDLRTNGQVTSLTLVK